MCVYIYTHTHTWIEKVTLEDFTTNAKLIAHLSSPSPSPILPCTQNYKLVQVQAAMCSGKMG